MKKRDFAAVLAASLFFFASGASATIYPIGISINGTPFASDDVQLPESPQSVYGVRIGLARAGHDEMAGLAVAVGYNSDSFAGGFQIAALGKNFVKSADWGLWQIAPFGNKLEGGGGVFQLSLDNEIDGDAEGLQFGFYNEAVGTFDGVQVGTINANGEGKRCDFSGLQIGAVNSDFGRFSGVQIGLLNMIGGGSSASFRGLQIGAINYIECPPASCVGVQIGVANVTSGRDWGIGFVPGLRVIF